MGIEQTLERHAAAGSETEARPALVASPNVDRTQELVEEELLVEEVSIDGMCGVY